MILITRPKKNSIQLAIALREYDHEVFLEPLTEISILEKKINYDKKIIYIFASINSVRAAKKNKFFKKNNLINCVAIGKKVRDELKLNLFTKLIFFTQNSDELIKKIKLKNNSKQNYVYLSSNIVRNNLINELKKSNISIKRKIIYKTIKKQKFTKKLINKIKGNKIKCGLFLSKSSAEIFIRLFRQHKLINDGSNIKIVCLSERIAKTFYSKKNRSIFGEIYHSKFPTQKSIILRLKQ